MLNNNQLTTYSNLKKEFHGQLIICGSAAMFYYGLIDKFPETDFDLILLHRHNSPTEIEEDMKKLELISITNSKKPYEVKEQSEEDKKIGKRYFLIFNHEVANKKIENFNVDIFVSNSLMHDGVCLAHYPGMEVFMASPRNVIMAKKLFGRTKDLMALSEMAKSIMP